MTAGSPTFFIGELAERTGVSRDAIRYYEASGVLPPADRSGSGYRVYRQEDADRIVFLGQARNLGLTLDEIAEILEIVGQGRDPCGHVRQRLVVRLEETRDRIRRLRGLERRLEEALDLSHDRPTEAECRCHLIEHAAELESSPGRDVPAAALS